MAGGLVVTRGQERCLYVFPMDEFLKVTQQMQAAPTTSKAVRDFTRVFLSGASDEVPDKQGRVTIPATLRAYLPAMWRVLEPLPASIASPSLAEWNVPI